MYNAMLDEDNDRFVFNDSFIDLTTWESKLLGFLIDRKDGYTPLKIICSVFYESDDRLSRSSIAATVCRLNKKLKGIVQIKFEKIGYKVRYMYQPKEKQIKESLDMTDKELNKKINSYWRYLKSALNVLCVNSCVTDAQYNAISKKIDKICFKEIKDD